MRLLNGRAFRPDEWSDTGAPIIRIQNLNDPDSDFNFFSGVVDERNVVRPGDLLFAWSGTTGSSFGARVWTGPEGVLNQHIFKVLPDPRKLSSAFAYRLLLKAQYSIERQAHGFKASFVHVKKSDLVSVSAGYPPTLEEQDRIAEALENADALIDSLEQLLTKKRQIKQGAMQELLTGKRRLPGYETPWIRRPFSEVACVSRERVNPSALNTPPLCVELEHLQPGTGRLVGDVFESQQAATKSVFRQGDVLFGKLRAYLRKYWLAEFEGVCSTEIWVLRPRGELASNAYLFYTIQRDDFIDVASNAYGTHMPRSDWKIVSEFSLSLPGDGMEQAAIAQVLSDMDTEISTIESRLTKARALKQAMAQALLTGRIRLVPGSAA